MRLTPTFVFEKEIVLSRSQTSWQNVYRYDIRHRCVQVALPGGSSTQTSVDVQRTLNDVTKQLTGSPCGLVVAGRCPSKVDHREVNSLSRSSLYNPGRLGRAAVCLISHRAGQGTGPRQKFFGGPGAAASSGDCYCNKKTQTSFASLQQIRVCHCKNCPLQAR